MTYLKKLAVLFVYLVMLAACGPRATPTAVPTALPTIPAPTATETPAFPLGNWHDMFYHEPSRRIILMNGGPENGKAATDPLELWTWNGNEWIMLVSDSNGPRWRNFASIAYNSNRDVLVMYGGLTAEQNYADTWEWDGKTWTRFTVEGPGTRESAGMTYDSTRDRVVLFGGAQAGRMMNDTWEWDGTSWTNVSSDGPSPRFPAGFTYDPIQKHVLLFGGHMFDGQSLTTHGDTWAWDGAHWQQVSSTGPSARDGARAVFIPTIGQVLLFGGAEIGTNVTNLNDTWLWDENHWERMDIQGPTPRVHAAMAYHDARDVLVLTGGSNGPGAILRDTWEWNGQAWACRNGC
jgi:hypothetical protein